MLPDRIKEDAFHVRKLRLSRATLASQAGLSSETDVNALATLTGMTWHDRSAATSRHLRHAPGTLAVLVPSTTRRTFDVAATSTSEHLNFSFRASISRGAGSSGKV